MLALGGANQHLWGPDSSDKKLLKVAFHNGILLFVFKSHVYALPLLPCQDTKVNVLDKSLILLIRLETPAMPVLQQIISN